MQKLLDPLVAQEDIVFFKITFNANANDVEGKIDSINVKAGNSVKLPDSKGFTRKDYTFTCWTTDRRGSEKQYAAGDEYIPKRNTTFYAQWERTGIHGPVVNVTDEFGENLIEKLKWIEENADSDTTYVIVLNDGETLAASELTYSGKSNITIQISGGEGGKSINLSASDKPLFTIGKGVTLELSEVTLKGKEGNSASLVYVEGGELIINGGVTITGNDNKYNGGAVYVANDGTFTMNGGEISGNNAVLGGGVYVYSGTFNMNDGEISNNTAQSGGGVYVANDGTFTMESGTISGNKATVNGGGVYNSGTFNMEGGEIGGGNSANANGGGVYNNGAFIMTDGKISGNSANANGGGVYVDINSEFTMNGGEISYNTVNGIGGGVYVNRKSEFAMYSGEISGNKATGSGGGVYVFGVEGEENPDSKFIAGGTAKVFENNGGNGLNNVFLDWWSYITPGEGANVPNGMKIYVQTAEGFGVIVFKGATKEMETYFISDDLNKEVIFQLQEGEEPLGQLIMIWNEFETPTTPEEE